MATPVTLYKWDSFGKIENFRVFSYPLCFYGKQLLQPICQLTGDVIEIGYRETKVKLTCAQIIHSQFVPCSRGLRPQVLTPLSSHCSHDLRVDICCRLPSQEHQKKTVEMKRLCRKETEKMKINIWEIKISLRGQTCLF